MSKRGLVWFKNDLRLHDNEALTRAHKECSELVCCYCLERSDFHMLDLGFRKMDINRFKFLEQSVTELQYNLELLGCHLVIGKESALVTLPELVNKYGITDVFAEEQYASYELDLVKKVKAALPDTMFHFFWGKTLYHKDDIPFKIDKIPLTSKAYRIPAAKEAEPREPFAVPASINPVKKIESNLFPSWSEYGFVEEEYKRAAPFLQGANLQLLSGWNITLLNPNF